MADQPPRPMVMDPPHITEFGSEAFHEKLNQHSTQQEHGQQQPTPDSLDTAPAGPSRFIVPVRESRTVEAEVVKPSHQKRDKGRLRTLRSKVSFLHSKTSYVEVTALPPLPAEPLNISVSEPRRPSAVSTRSTLPFDQHFLSLPNELQIQIISSLPLSDVLNLRLASKSWHALISLNEAPIVRYHLDNHIPAYAKRLYPASDPSKLNFHHLCGLWHRLHVAAKLSFLMCEWITKDIFLRQTEAQRLLFAPQHERMRRRLIPLLFTIFHFFETYRKLHLEHIAEHGGHGLQREPYTLNPIEAKIMSMYDDKTLLRVHEVFPLVISSFCRRLRPPTYVGRVERSLRGYIREKPSDEMHAAILTIGGLREVERLWEIKGYNNRRGAVDTWYYSLMKEQPPPETNTKSRRGFFGRKKQAGGDPIRFGDGQSRRPSAGNDITMGYDNLVFNTSLAAGAPMSSLDQQQVQALLGDLPVLQQIWSYTAEALILERRIVDRPQDIMRNQQVMLNLIREDGMDEEDEWWYGRGIPDSVRPPAAGITDDDAD